MGGATGPLDRVEAEEAELVAKLLICGYCWYSTDGSADCCC